MNIFETIRKQTNEQNAASVRERSGVDIKREALECAKEAMKDVGRLEIDRLVDLLLERSARAVVDGLVPKFPELQGKAAAATEARQALVESAVLSGQYFKIALWNVVSSTVNMMNERVAESIGDVLREAYVESYRSRSSRALPLPK